MITSCRVATGSSAPSASAIAASIVARSLKTGIRIVRSGCIASLIHRRRLTACRDRKPLCGEQCPVEAVDVLDEPRHPVARKRPLAALLAHPPAELGIGGEPRQVVCGRIDVADGEEVAVGAVGDDIGDAADARGDDRPAGGECLDRADRRALVARGQEQGVEGVEPRPDVVLEADEVGRLLDPELASRAPRAPAGRARRRPSRAPPRGPARAAGSPSGATSWARFTAVIRPTQPIVNRSCGMPSEARSSSPCSEPCMRSESSMPSRTTAKRDAGATPISTSSSRHLGADGDERIGLARERALDQAVRLLLRRSEVALQRMAVERVDDDRRARWAGEARPRRAPPCPPWRYACGGRAGAPAGSARRAAGRRRRRGGGTPRAAAPGSTAPRCRVARRRRPSRPRPGDLAGREGRLVPARREPLGQIRDVERRAAHVEAGDHTQHANRFVCSEHERER